MSRATSPLFPRVQRRLNLLGERIRNARRRRGLPAALVAERAGMSLMTLRAIEQGRPNSTIGAYTAVLHALGLDADLDAVAATDPIGRDLQDAGLKRRQHVKL